MANIQLLIDQLPDAKFLTEPAEMKPYTVDASPAPADGEPIAVFCPHSTEEVAIAMAWANEHEVPVSVWGAGSGVAGGAVAYENGLVVALHEMNEILEIDPASRIARVQAGVMNEDLDKAAREHNLFFAPDPASSAISTIGGNIATNAGGLRCIAYGNTAQAVAELTVVLADGSVVHTGSRTMKNTTGLNLTQLFVGSEGALGVITEATVWLLPVPNGGAESFLASFDTITDAGRAVVGVMGSEAQLENLELLDAQTAAWIEEDTNAGLPQPKAALLMGMARGTTASQSVDVAVEICAAMGAVEIRREEGDAAMKPRKLAHSAQVSRGEWVFGDVGVPVPRLPELIEAIEEIEREVGIPIRHIAHAGDGNMHPSVLVVDGDREGAERALDRITIRALELHGVITGEHGIGKLKHHELAHQFDDATLALQRRIKEALDPKGILSPGRAV